MRSLPRAAMRGARLLLGGLLAGAVLGGAAHAQDATIGVRAGPVSLDPHSSGALPHLGALRNVFDALVRRGPAMEIEPNLAESWNWLDDTTLEIRLRQDVRWHDGTPFTAEDVVSSFDRIPTMPGGAGGLANTARLVSIVVLVTPHTVRLRTREPAPTLLHELDRLLMRQAQTNPTLSGVDSAVGTGPYRYVSWAPGKEFVLERSEDYWGTPKPHFRQVILREIPNDADRMAGLLSGDLDMVAEVPPEAAAEIRSRPNLRIVQAPSVQTAMLHPDGRETAPAATDHEGQPLPANPFRDLRVRRALSLALDRDAIARGALAGLAFPTAAPLPASFFGMPRDLPAPRYDAPAARRLLAEAGYPRGFRVRLHCTSGRFAGDERVCAALVEALGRIGIVAEPRPLPAMAYFAGFARGDHSLSMNAWGTVTGDATYMLAGMFHSRGGRGPFGALNLMRYSNPEVDQLLRRSLEVTDRDARWRLVEQGMRIAMDDLAVIPIVNLASTWALNTERLSFEPRMDEATPVHRLRPPAR